MKIAVFKYVDNFGGGEQYTKTLTQVLHGNGCLAMLISNNRQLLAAVAEKNRLFFARGPEAKNKLSATISILRLPIDLLRYCYLLLVLKKHGVDVLILQDLNEKLIVPFLARLFGIQTIFFEHTRWEPHLVAHPLFPLLQLQARFVSKIISPSEFLKLQIDSNLHNSNKTIVIPHGVDKQNPEASLQKTRIVTIARLSPEKDIATLINSLPLLLDKKIKLLIIGDGPERDRLEKLAKDLRIEERIIFYGHKSKPYGLIAPDDIFVLPSHNENFPLVLLEAMSAGLGIVATNIDGVNEIIKNGHNGLLAEVGDKRSLARNIDRMLKDKRLKKKFKQNNIELFETRYNKEVMARSTIALVKEIAHEEE